MAIGRLIRMLGLRAAAMFLCRTFCSSFFARLRRRLLRNSFLCRRFLRYHFPRSRLFNGYLFRDSLLRCGSLSIDRFPVDCLRCRNVRRQWHLCKQAAIAQLNLRLVVIFLPPWQRVVRLARVPKRERL
jgi:hypothetical protein